MKRYIFSFFAVMFLLTTISFGAEGDKKWEFATEGAVYSSPAISDSGVVYVGSADDKLYAINPDGTKKWEFIAGDDISSSPAIGSDGVIYVGSYDNKLYAINPDGSKKWEFLTGSSVESSPAIGNDGVIYVGSDDGKLYAINPDGSKKWEFAATDAISMSPAIGRDGIIYTGSYDGKLYAINPDGSKKWEFATGNAIASSPAIGNNGVLYIGTWDNKLYAINPDGSKKWEFTAGGAVESSPAIGNDGVIYVGSDDGKLYAINPDGSKKWEFAAGNAIASSPAIGSDNIIYVGSYDSKLYAINPDGSKKWEFTAGYIVNSSPAIGSDGVIYVGSYDGNFYALQSSSLGLANSSWSRYCHDNRGTGNINLTGRNIRSDQKISGLYAAFFNRAPDKGGLGWWKNRAKTVESEGKDVSTVLKELSEGFAQHPVFTSTYGSLKNQEFVEAIYLNSLGRAGDSEGIAYWTNELNNGLTRPDMVSNFIEMSLTLILTPQNFPNLSQSELDAAKLRQDLITNKVNVAIDFVEKLGDKTNVVNQQNPENDPAYIASIKILSHVTEDSSTVTTAEDYLNSIKENSDPIKKIINEWGNSAGKIIASLDMEGSIQTIVQDGSTLFLGSYDGILYAVDVSDVNSPHIIGTLDTQDIIEGMDIDRGTKRVFLANNQKGMTVVDVSTPNNPQIITSKQSGYARAIKINYGTVYVASGYDGINLFHLNTYEKIQNTPVNGDYTDSIEVVSNYAFTSDAFDKNITVTDINSGTKVSSFEKLESFYNARKDIVAKGDYLYVADNSKGLLIYNITDISSIALLSSIEPSEEGLAKSVIVSNDETKAYVSAWSAGIDIYDITDKSAPKLVKTVDTPGASLQAVLSDSQQYLYIADTAGLQIIKLQ